MVRISSVNLSSTRNAHTGQETYRVRIEMRERKNSNERTDMPCRVLFNASNELIFNGPVRRVALHLEIPFSMISFSPILALSLPTRVLQLLNDYDGDYREKSAILFQMNGVCDCAACSRLRKEWVDEFARRSTQMQTKKKWQTPKRGIHSIWLLWFGRWLMRWCVWSVEGALHSGSEFRFTYCCQSDSDFVLLLSLFGCDFRCRTEHPLRQQMHEANGIFSGFVCDFARNRRIHFRRFFLLSQSRWYVWCPRRHHILQLHLFRSKSPYGIWGSSEENRALEASAEFDDGNGAIDRRTISNEPTFAAFPCTQRKDLFLCKR